MYSRRQFLAGLLASSVAAGFSGRRLRAEQKALRLNWWGETEAPGLKTFIESAAAAFETQTGIQINATLMSADNVIPDFEKQSAAGQAPDVQFLWNGIFHMENVWKGYLAPLNGLLADDVLFNSNATVLSQFQHRQYRFGWYTESIVYVYNKQLFAKAGLPTDQGPATWDAFLSACEALKRQGTLPLVGGLKDGYWGEWWMGYGLTQNLDTPADALNLFSGTFDWREPKYWQHWAILDQMVKSNYFNSDFGALSVYEGIDLFSAGKGAMTAISLSLLSRIIKQLGPENVGLMTFPKFGQGAMAGRPIIDTSGFGISSQSKDPASAARFLTFLGSVDQMQNLFTATGGVLPAGLKWPGTGIHNDVTQVAWQRWVRDFDGQGVPYISNLMPTQFWTDAMFVNSQQIVAGQMSPEQTGDLAAHVAGAWRQDKPGLVDKYSVWANDLRL